MKKHNKFYSFIIIFVLVFLIFSFSIKAEENSSIKLNEEELSSLETTVVKKVIDGDTIKIANGKNLRFIGINTPEINWDNGTADFYGYKALAFTKNRLLNKKVYLEYDKEKRDDYGRLLAYIYLEDGELFNTTLLEKGYAHLMTVEPNSKYLNLFKNSLLKARDKGIGIWKRIDQLQENLPVISWENAANYYDKKVIVKGKIVNTYKAEEVTFLNFSENHSETLTIVIFNDDLNKFSFQPQNFFLNKNIKVNGKIKKYEGVPEIIIENPTSIIINRKN